MSPAILRYPSYLERIAWLEESVNRFGFGWAAGTLLQTDAVVKDGV